MKTISATQLRPILEAVQQMAISLQMYEEDKITIERRYGTAKLIYSIRKEKK